MTFHLGKPIAVMLALTVVGGAWVAVRPSARRAADLTVWVSAQSHQETYVGRPGASLTESFARQTGKSVAVELVPTRSEDVRLVSLFMSNSRDVPDAVEVEIGSVAKYFRPPVDEVGFLPLNDFLTRSGRMGQIVQARLAPWSKGGVIFGVPHDVHPVALVYRHDLFAEANVDLSAARTWPEFQAACVKFQDYWRSHGQPDRHAMELSAGSAEHLLQMLLQRHLNPIDGDGRIAIADDKFVETLAFYATCVAGPTDIAAQSPGVAGGFARDLNAGNICAFPTADWRLAEIKRDAPTLAGKFRVIPLPVFEPGDARTATWGGTMIGIPRNCKDPAASWALIEHLYLSSEGLAARRGHGNILPPITSAWSHEAYQRPDPFFANEKVDRLYIELANELPRRHVTPATSMAGVYLSKAIMDAAAYVRAHPGDHAGLVVQCRAWMQKYEADLKRRIEHGRLDE